VQMSKRSPVAKEALPYLGICVLLGVLAYWLNPWASLVPGALGAFVAFFFRDPPREIPDQPEAITAPADGRIIQVCEVYEDRFLNQQATRVSIFLSLLDVHLNRSPIGGRVTYLKYERGRFRPAFVSSAPAENERNFIGIQGGRGEALVVQIAGVLARRIVCWMDQGEAVEKGQRFGMIRFGSRTELFLPQAATEVLVQPGDRVKAGETIVGRWIT